MEPKFRIGQMVKMSVGCTCNVKKGDVGRIVHPGGIPGVWFIRGTHGGHDFIEEHLETLSEAEETLYGLKFKNEKV